MLLKLTYVPNLGSLKFVGAAFLLFLPSFSCVTEELLLESLFVEALLVEFFDNDSALPLEVFFFLNCPLITQSSNFTIGCFLENFRYVKLSLKTFLFIKIIIKVEFV